MLVLSLHQPLASLIAYGLQRLDGRTWASDHRGPLWIHAAAKEPSHEDIQSMEGFHAEVFRELSGNDDAQPTLPPSYPTSCLLGCVDMVDCVSAEEYTAWPTLPLGVREEARIHGDGKYFLFENHQRLVLPQRMPGQHKLWKLEHELARSLWDGGLRPSAQAPVSWAGVRSGLPGAGMPPKKKRPVFKSEPSTPPPATAPPSPSPSTVTSRGGPEAPPPPADTFDDWMLSHAMELSTSGFGTHDDACAAAALQQAIDVADGLDDDDDEIRDTDHAVVLSLDQHPPIIGGHEDHEAAARMALLAVGDGGDERWAPRVAELTRMGFDEVRSKEMLALCDGDVEGAVALLCS